MACRECGLHIHSDPTCIPGSGNIKSDIMIISSYAGDQDEDHGEATMSPSLLQFMERLGLSPDEVYYTNAIKCRTPKGTKYKVGEINKCKVYLQEEIEKVNPKYVLVIGAQALKATVGGAITTLNGVTIEHEGRSYIPSYSPGVVYRDPGKAPFVDQALNNFINLTKGKVRELPELNIKILKSQRDINRAFREIKEKGYKVFSYDIETTGLDRYEDEITLLGFGNGQVQYIIPLEVKFSPLAGKKLAQKKLIRDTIKRLNSDLFGLIAGNGKFDNLFLQHHFGAKPFITFDIVLGSHILNENTANGVKENAILECNALDWDINLDLKKGGVKTRQDYEDYITYLGYDIYYEYKLYKVFKSRINKDKSLKKLFNHLYMPVIRAYEEIEEQGVYVYMDKFKETRKYLEGELAKIVKQLDKYQKGINWSSPAQIGGFLYDKLKLPILEVTEAGNPSTSESVLMRLRDKHPAVELILQYRGVNIQISHFIDGWINRMVDGRLHPNFKLLTVTGRTSCTDPNLQQVPRDPRIRTLIGAPKGKSFVEVDFSQAELRIATIMSGDPAMYKVYQEGGDIHTHTYELVTGKSLSGDKYEQKEQRKMAKATNFGLLYGMGWKKYKEYARDNYEVQITDQEAKDFRIKFFKVYGKLPEWHARQRRIVKSMGQVRNPIGRIRRLPDIYSSDKGKVAEAERQSINSPVQGLGSDLTLLGMAEIMQHSLVYHKHLRLDRSKFISVGTVHDATLFEVDDDYLEVFIPTVKKVLEKPKALKDIFHFESPIPILVDVTIGESWGNGIELKFEDDKWKDQLEEYLSLRKK